MELLIALSITAALLTATMVALDASYRAYQTTAETASSHTVSRLALHRMLTLVRTGEKFGPYPQDPTEPVIRSDYMEFVAPNGQLMVLEWESVDNALSLAIHDWDPVTEDWNPDPTAKNTLLGGVIAQFNNDGTRRKPFTLEYEFGKQLYRATIDLAVIPDESQAMEFDGVPGQSNAWQQIRLVGSAMPRSIAYDRR